MMKPTLFALSLIFAAFAAHAEPWPYPGWQDTPQTRIKAEALLQTLNAQLLSSRSATRTLTEWCADHHLAPEARIRALRDKSTQTPANAEVRALLQVDEQEPLAYRRVKLMCGERVLSEADNWYVPARLSKEMNRQLDSTDIPFGAAVQALNFYRRTEAAQVLWHPLPERWEMKAPTLSSRDDALDIAPFLLRHRAVLLSGSRPFSVVEETYRSELFAFPLAR